MTPPLLTNLQALLLAAAALSAVAQRAVEHDTWHLDAVHSCLPGSLAVPVTVAMNARGDSGGEVAANTTLTSSGDVQALVLALCPNSFDPHSCARSLEMVWAQAAASIDPGDPSVLPSRMLQRVATEFFGLRQGPTPPAFAQSFQHCMSQAGMASLFRTVDGGAPVASSHPPSPYLTLAQVSETYLPAPQSLVHPLECASCMRPPPAPIWVYAWGGGGGVAVKGSRTRFVVDRVALLMLCRMYWPAGCTLAKARIQVGVHRERARHRSKGAARAYWQP